MAHVIGNYEIRRELGRGGMGIVYEAHEQSLQRVVALKILASHLAKDPAYVARFLREARAAAQLSHPGIAHIYSIGESSGLHYIAMEYVKGKTLAHWIRDKGAFSVERALDITRQAADALAVAHAAGIIHRDVKPQNIMLDDAGRVKVMDFGLARVQAAATALTRTGVPLGTPLYMSPEQIQGGHVDARADVYALGVTLYEMLAGQPPFDADTPLALMYQIVHQPFPDVAKSGAAIPADVRRLVSRMTAKQPEERYESAGAVRDAITSLSTGVAHPTPAIPAAPPEAGKMPAPQPATARPPVRKTLETRFRAWTNWAKAKWAGTSKRAKRAYAAALVFLLLVLAPVLFVRVVLGIGIVRVAGAAMEPTLQTGDRVLVRRASSFERGDVVLVERLAGSVGLQMRRIVALEGDTVEVRGGILQISGHPIRETYVKQTAGFDDVALSRVKPGEAVLAVDNRGLLGGVQPWLTQTPLEQIRGRAVYIFMPGNRRGSIDPHREVFAGVSSDTPFQITADQFPLRVGAKWTFRMQSADRAMGGKTYTREFFERTENNGEAFYRQRAVFPGQSGPSDDCYWSRRRDGIYGYSSPSDAKACFMLFKAPLAVGLEWETELVAPTGDGTGGKAPTRAKYRADAEETVTVPAGQFRCIRIRSRDIDASGNEVVTWVAPDVGEVKLTTGSVTISLVSFEGGPGAPVSSAASSEPPQPIRSAEWIEVNSMLDNIEAAYGRHDFHAILDTTHPSFLTVLDVPGNPPSVKMATRSTP